MKIEIEHHPTPADMADEFADWGADEQAAFLNSVARLFLGWSGQHGQESQALSIAGRLTPDARKLVADIALFSTRIT